MSRSRLPICATTWMFACACLSRTQNSLCAQRVVHVTLVEGVVHADAHVSARDPMCPGCGPSLDLSIRRAGAGPLRPGIPAVEPCRFVAEQTVSCICPTANLQSCARPAMLITATRLPARRSSACIRSSRHTIASISALLSFVMVRVKLTFRV